MARGRGSSEFRLRLVASEVEKASEEFRRFGQIGQESMDRLRRSLTPVNDNLRKVDDAASGFKNQLRGMASNIAVLDGPLGGIASRFNALATAIGRMGFLLGGVLLGLTAGSFLFAKLVRDTSGFERAMQRLGNVLRASGNDAVVALEEINAVATQLARDTLTNIAEAREAAAVVVGSPNIENIAQIERVLALAQDITEVLGGDLRSNAQFAARVFDAPTRAIELLQRRGVTLSETLKENIRDLEASGNRSKAAALAFEELERRFGGAGIIAGLPGAIDLAQVEMERLIDLTGEFLRIGELGEAVFLGIADAARAIGDALEREVRPTVAQLEEDLQRLVAERDKLRAPSPAAGTPEARQRLGEIFSGVGRVGTDAAQGEAEGRLSAQIDAIERQIQALNALRASRDKAGAFVAETRRVDALIEQERKLQEALEAVSQAFTDQRERQLKSILESAGGPAALGAEGVAEITEEFEKQRVLAEARVDAEKQAAAIRRTISQLNDEDQRAQEKFFADRERAQEKAAEDAKQLAERFDDAIRSLQPETEDRLFVDLIDRVQGSADAAALGEERVAALRLALGEKIHREELDREREKLSVRLENEARAAQEIIARGEETFRRQQEQERATEQRQFDRFRERLDPTARFERFDALIAERRGRIQEPQGSAARGQLEGELDQLRQLGLLELVDLPPVLERLEDSGVRAFSTVGDAALAMAQDVEDASEIMQATLSSLLTQFAQTLLQVGAIDPLARAASTAIRQSFVSGGAAAGVNAFFAGGFQHGGEFTVPGSGGPDSVLTSMLTSPGERVRVDPPGGASLSGEALLRVLVEGSGGGATPASLAGIADAIANRSADMALRRLVDGAGGRNRTVMRTLRIGRR